MPSVRETWVVPSPIVGVIVGDISFVGIGVAEATIVFVSVADKTGA
jgi:hypothetical protein